MVSYRKKSIKKLRGGALPYVLIVTALLFSFMFFLNKSYGIEGAYFNNYSMYLMEESEINKKKEYLISDFNKYMMNNLTEINEKTVRLYFLQKILDGEFKQGYNCVYYDSTGDVFKINLMGKIYSFYPIIEDGSILYEFK